MALTGRLWKDNDQNGNYDPPGDIPWGGITLHLTGDTDGIDRSAVTAADGTYSIPDGGMTVGNYYHIQTSTPDYWATTNFAGIVGNPTQYRMSQFGEVRDAGYYPYHRYVASSWLYKLEWIQGPFPLTASAIRATYKTHNTGKHANQPYFSCIYPGTFIPDYLAWVQAASKGEWARLFYYKVRPYIVVPPSL